MFRFALKILRGDKAKYIGIILGLTFASFIIVQQAAIFIGLMTRTFGFITDTSQSNIWVMDPKVQFVDDIKPMNITELFRVRSIEGVEWAVPLFKGIIRASGKEGNFQNTIVIGIDNATFIGRPPVLLEGSIEALRNTDAIIVSKEGAENQLANIDPKTGDKYPLQIGNTIELNDNRAVVVGICDISRTFQTQPVIYTTYRRAVRFAPTERKNLSFVLVKSAPWIKPEDLCRRIERITGLSAYSDKQFTHLTVNYFLRRTGILLNFGVAIVLGFIIGVAIAGQTFYNFTLDNLRYFGTFKAMGADNDLLKKMILLQSAVVGTIGWGLGIGAASLFGLLSRGTQLSFRLPWPLFIGSFVAMLLICLTSAYISIHRIRRLEPAIVFKS
ncbi:MAG: putative ABC transporter permease [Chlamydiae bacterium]|nr:putative ABC transporter permease [Chlamydiota bacterium]